MEKMVDKQPSVLIVILNYGTYDLTIEVIKQLYENLEYDNYRVMVVDNCSPNESADVLKKKSKELNYIFFANSVNSGYATGNNIGIRYAIDNDFQYTWILNNDVELREKNVLKELVCILQMHEEIGCIGPKIYNADGTILSDGTLW